jgi:hypothetical protein
MNLVQSIATVPLLVLVASSASAQDCRAKAGEAYSQQRRDAAVRYLIVLHAAEVRSQLETGRFAPLNDLRGLVSAPVGFVPRLVLDQWSYVVRLTDVFDPCGFALFLDDHGIIYEARRQEPPLSSTPDASGPPPRVLH